MAGSFPDIPLASAEIMPALGSHFVGRAKEMLALRTALIEDANKLVFVSGARGMGKTSLVCMFCESAAETFPGGIEYTYAHSSWRPHTFNLRSLDLSRKSLVVLDDADLMRARDLAVFESSLSRFPKLSAIVVTSRPPRAAKKSSVIIHLKPFSENEWEMLLRSQLADYDPIAAKEFYRHVAGHPQLLSLGASIICEGGDSWRALLAQLEAFQEPGILGPDGLPYDPNISLPEPIVEVSVHLEEKLYKAITANPDLMYTLSPRDFERLVAELLDRQGYNITLTPPSKDGGVDIYAAKSTELGQFLFLVECKKYAKENRVQIDIVRALYGNVQAKKATAGIIVTTSSFTRGAKQFQQELKHQLQLRDYVNLRQWLSDTRHLTKT